MPAPALHKLTHQQATSLSQLVKLSDRSAQLLTPHLATADYLIRLIKRRYYPEACQVLAHALPTREAIWWAYLNAKNSTSNDDLHALTTLYLVKQWVYAPNEDNRIAAYMMNENKQPFVTPASWSALAVYWSKPPDNSDPKRYASLAGNAVSTSVLLAAHVQAQGDMTQQPARLQHAIQQGIHIANGGNGQIAPNPTGETS